MIKVLGVPELLTRFARAAVLAEEAAHVATLAEAEKVAQTARAIVPVDTGTLRDSIHAESTAEGGLVAAAVVSDVEYAPYVEYGTSTNDAQPYMRPAADSSHGEAATAAGAIVLQGI